MRGRTHVTKSKKRKAKNMKPDDHFTAGPIELARFGRVMIGRSQATQEQFEAAQARMVAQYPTTVSEIEVLVASIAAQIVRLPPDRLLQRGWWGYSAMMVGLGGSNAGDPEKLAAVRMVDYVQSVIASVKQEQYAADVSEEDWTKLKADVETLFQRLTLDYQICLTALAGRRFIVMPASENRMSRRATPRFSATAHKRNGLSSPTWRNGEICSGRLKPFASGTPRFSRKSARTSSITGRWKAKKRQRCSGHFDKHHLTAVRAQHHLNVDSNKAFKLPLSALIGFAIAVPEDRQTEAGTWSLSAKSMLFWNFRA